jgi:hypothetical protein
MAKAKSNQKNSNFFRHPWDKKLSVPLKKNHNLLILTSLSPQSVTKVIRNITDFYSRYMGTKLNIFDKNYFFYHRLYILSITHCAE